MNIFKKKLAEKELAISWMLLSALSFALMGAMVKLASEVPVIEKVFFRNLVTFILMLIIISKNRENPFKQGKATKFLIYRSLAGLAGVVLYFYAISNMTLADSTMLNKLSPFFVIVFAGIFLKEGFNLRKVIVIILAFGGALLIIKPQFDMSIIPAVSGFLSAVFAGLAYTLVRFLKSKSSSSMIVFYFSTISVLGTLPLIFTSFVMPSSLTLLLLVSIGIFAGIGQIALTKAYHLAPASEISIYNYASILFATIIGVLIGDSFPDIYSILGGIIIFLTAYYNYVKMKKAKN
jgi:drug/metabolite transporter (DMT)-like permease